MFQNRARLLSLLPAMNHLTQSHVHEAVALLCNKTVRTPVLYSSKISEFLSQQFGTKRSLQAFLKCENLQRSGSFKYRGALHSLLKLSYEQLRKGVVTYSTGKFMKQIFRRPCCRRMPVTDNWLNRKSCVSTCFCLEDVISTERV